MGKMFSGILGGFTGTVGTVIGSSNRNGDDLIRVKSKRPRTSNSVAQANQRTKFGLVTSFLQVINFILKFSFKQVAGDTMSSYNYAVQYALKNAIKGEAPDFELDYSKVQISDGQLSRETIAAAELLNGKVNFHWEDNTGSGNCSATDKAILLVYNVDQSEVSYSIGAVTRGMKAGSLALPYNEVGDTLLFYMFFQSATDEILVSSSHFLGKVVIG